MASQSVQNKELCCFRITFPSGLEIIMKPQFQKQEQRRQFELVVESSHLLCRSSGPSSAGGRRAPVSRVEGEGALPPLGDEEVAVLKVAKAEGAVVAFGDATGCVREDN